MNNSVFAVILNGRRYARLFSLVLGALVASATANGEVRLAGIFTDRCVLQRDMPVAVWGWAEPGEQVDVELGAFHRKAAADVAGKWTATFDPMPAGGPFVLKASGSSVAEAKELLIGEVWIGVGQSNMMMGVGSSQGGAEALTQIGDYPNLRMAHEQGRIAVDPQQDIKPVRWNAPNPSSSAASFYFARELYKYFNGKVPVGILNFTEIRPAEAWTDGKLLEGDAVGKLSMPPQPGWDSGRLYNGVVAPVAPFAIRGVLYYQGEMNGGTGRRFHPLMTLLIQSWRNAWNNPHLPFLFVQLPGFQDHRAGTDKRMDMDAATLARLNQGSQHGFVNVREAQMLTFREVPYTGMAVTIDVGLPWDIHPPYKRQVGERLFLQARHVAYGENNFAYNGPIMKSVEFLGQEVRSHFDLCGSHLVFKDGSCEGFQLAGSNLQFHPAEGRIEGDSVVLKSSGVSQPVMVRYAWAGYPNTSLFNAEGLPAAPFQWTDYARIGMDSRAQFELQNPGFVGQEGWNFNKGAELAKLPDGTSAARLPLHAEVTQPSSRPGGLSFNCDLFDAPHFARPGSLIGYSLEMALADKEEGTALGYFRLAGSGNYFDQTNVSTTSPKFGPRLIALRVPFDSRQGGAEFISFANVSRENRPDLKSFVIRSISPMTIVRPEISWDGPETIRLGEVKANTGIDSKPMTLANGQKTTLPVRLDDVPTESGQSATILFGLADVAPDEIKSLRATQTVHLGGNVGMVLIGAEATMFRLVGDHATDDGSAMRLLGADEKPGLAGGPNPEKESVVVRFKGANKPGEYRAVLRIVTQAANKGHLSQAGEGEPPINLFYLDVPISVLVQ